MYIALILIFGLLLGIGGLLAYQEFVTKVECTPAFLSWAKANCPGFEGAAL